MRVWCSGKNSATQAPLDVFFPKSAKPLDARGAGNGPILFSSASTPCILVVKLNQAADSADRAFRDQYLSTLTGSRIHAYEKSLFPPRKWIRIELESGITTTPLFVTADELPFYRLTESQAIRLHAKLRSLLPEEKRDRKEIRVPLIAANEWHHDDTNDGWCYVDTSSGITFWLRSHQELIDIYGPVVADSALVIRDQDRTIADWAPDRTWETENKGLQWKPFADGNIVFPHDAAKAHLFNLATQCLNCLRDEEMPKAGPLRSFAAENQLSIEKVLFEAYKRRHILFDDIGWLAAYLEDDEAECREYESVCEEDDVDPEAKAEETELVLIYGSSSQGRWRQRVDREKRAGLRFFLCRLPTYEAAMSMSGQAQTGQRISSMLGDVQIDTKEELPLPPEQSLPGVASSSTTTNENGKDA